MLKAMPNAGKRHGPPLACLGADNVRELIEGVKGDDQGLEHLELLDVRANDNDETRAKRNVEDMITGTS